jgi:DNA (cytosine-5)-methyltransferase 1
MAAPRAWYNENDPFAAAWLRELIACGALPAGDVDTRSIWDVLPEDLRGYTQCHFFAGIGGWAYACRLAGIADNEPIWTGSCPCQPFSAAGKGLGFADERHAWPAWWHLIEYWHPPVIVGEQVDKAAAWLDLVLADLETENYTCWATDLPAGSVGAYHKRQRLWFVAERLANAQRARGESRGPAGEPREGAGAPGAGASTESGRRGDAGDANRAAGIVGHPDHPRSQGLVERRHGTDQRSAGAPGLDGELADADGWFTSDGRLQRSGGLVQLAQDPAVNFWRDADWLPCRDGKSRPVEPGTFPLAHGIPARVGRLRGYGNAVVPQVGAAILRAYRAERDDRLAIAEATARGIIIDEEVCWP